MRRSRTMLETMRTIAVVWMIVSAIAAGVVLVLGSRAVARAIRLVRGSRRFDHCAVRRAMHGRGYDGQKHYAPDISKSHIPWAHRPATGRRITANELPLADRLEFADALEALDEHTEGGWPDER